jgi:RNA 3'-terminal phosphate cyclase (ATP)
MGLRLLSDELVQIDGSQGEGGGQMVRSSLSLALVTGRSVEIKNIRARRKKPGLMEQHLTAVRAAAEVGDAEIVDDRLYSKQVLFRPGKVRGGNYAFKVRTAGSATLVMQTVLPALLTAPQESRLRFEGGTHNSMAPPFDFLAKAFLPLVNRIGPSVAVQLQRPGFYPAGGGEFTATVRPSSIGRLELIERGKLRDPRVRVLLSYLPAHIGKRECAAVAKATGWDLQSMHIEEAKYAHGPGNVVMIELESEHVTEVFTSFGRIGVRAEDVATECLREAQDYLAADVPVGPHLADQLLLPLGIAAYMKTGGGTFQTMPLTEHSKTHIEILRRFLEIKIEVREAGAKSVIVEVG